MKLKKETIGCTIAYRIYIFCQRYLGFVSGICVNPILSIMKFQRVNIQFEYILYM